MNPNRKRLLVVLAWIVLIVLLDQISKHWIATTLTLGEDRQPIPALSDYFQLTYSYNTGAAFGIFQEAGDFFLVLAIVVVAGMLYYYPRLPENATITRWAIGLVCGGALGNATDRILHGEVIDFIHYQIPGVISNVSNLADHAIVLGVILMMIDNWRIERAEKRQKESESAESAPETEQNPS